MNNPRRKQLKKALELIAEARAIIEAMAEEEAEAYENMPEGLQESERGERIAENVDALEDIAAELEDHESTLEDVITG